MSENAMENSDIAKMDVQALSTAVQQATGRKMALMCLDNLIGDKGNIQTLRLAMQDEFDRDPVDFYKKIVMPMTPKQAESNKLSEGSFDIHINMVQSNHEAAPEHPIIDLQEVTTSG